MELSSESISKMLRAASALESRLSRIESQRAQRADAGREPYGNVTYADPGYQADKKKRYPINTREHIRSAWSYIHHPTNAGKYSPAHLGAIKRNIIRAWRDKVQRAGPPEAT